MTPIRIQLEADHPELTEVINGETRILSDGERAAMLDQWEADLIAKEATDARKTQRAAVEAQWAALPAWITGPFGHLFERASACLDDGKDDAAVAIIQYAEPPSAYSEEQRATFLQVRDALAASLASLGN